MSIAVINLHPDYSNSKRCKDIIEALKNAGITNIHNPRESIKVWDFTKEHVAAEQEVMKNAQHLVFVYPIHWFAMPAWAKAWLDQTFTDGFALNYSGARKAQLDGKKLTVICSAGG